MQLGSSIDTLRPAAEAMHWRIKWDSGASEEAQARMHAIPSASKSVATEEDVDVDDKMDEGFGAKMLAAWMDTQEVGSDIDEYNVECSDMVLDESVVIGKRLASGNSTSVKADV